MLDKFENVQYFMPLLQAPDEVFRPPEDIYLTANDLPLVSELKDYVSSHYNTQKGIVEIYNSLYEVSVYCPRDSRDYSYIIVDCNKFPLERSDEDQDPVTTADSTLHSWVSTVEYSESISPQESIAISDSFIEPDFEEIDAQGNSQENITWNSVSKMSRVIIIGAPGAGKTTTLRRLAKEHYDRWREKESDSFPVYVQMRHFHEEKGVQQIVKSKISTYGKPSERELGDIDIIKKRVILILDGLDEMPESSRQSVSAAIQIFAEQNRVVSIVASTREAGYHWKLPHFRYVRIRPFSKEKIREWTFYRLGNRFDGDWLQFITSLEERPLLSKIAGNPLLLSICVSLYRRNSVLPQNRAILLKNYLDAVVEQWDAIRGVVRQRESWATPARKLSALCRTAFNARRISQEYFTSADFVNWNSDLDVDEVLLDVCQRDTGVVIRSYDHDRWHFAHRIFSDYLAARYLVDHTGETGVEIEPFFQSGDWIDIWACSCGIAQDATSLVLQVIDSETIHIDMKIDSLSRAFEQDIIVSKSAIDKTVRIFQSEIDKILLSSELQLSGTEDRGSILIRSIPITIAQKVINLLNSLKRLRKTTLGIEIHNWLCGLNQHKAHHIAFMLVDESLMSIPNKHSLSQEVYIEMLTHLKKIHGNR